PDGASPDAEEAGLARQVEAFERAVLVSALRRAEGRVTDACATLNLPRKTFYDKLARHGLKADAFRG
ncbi:MAG: two-component system C4-dicarboxylate transport response regulator DctD, partial [Paracoccaceae bacterium]